MKRMTATEEIELVEIMIETICLKKANSNQDASVAPMNLMAELSSLQVARVLFKIRRSMPYRYLDSSRFAEFTPLLKKNLIP